jgi:hypothetical protein
MLMTVKTIFFRNTQPNTEKTLRLRSVTTTTTTQIKVENEDIYKVLADFSVIIQNLLYQFSLGRFKEVSNILNRRYYQYLSVKLSKLAYVDYPIYEQLRKSIRYSLEGLYKAVEQYGILVNCENVCDKIKEKASILDDMQKLKEYINSLKKQVTLFPDMNITIIRAEIKPEYAEYIKLYGYPAGGIFDMDKLGAILISMDLNNMF